MNIYGNPMLNLLNQSRGLSQVAPKNLNQIKGMMNLVRNSNNPSKMI